MATTRIRALNEECSVDASDVDSPVATKEAEESAAYNEYKKALEKIASGEKEEAVNCLQSLLDRPFLKEDSKSEDHSSLPQSAQTLKYSCLKNLGQIYSSLENIESALDYYLKAVDMNGNDTLLWYEIGKLSLKTANLNLASYSFNMALKRCPSHWPSIDGMLIVLYLGNDDLDCLYHISEAFKLDPQYLYGHVLRDRIVSVRPSIVEDFHAFYKNSDLKFNTLEYDLDTTSKALDKIEAIYKEKREKYRIYLRSAEYVPICLVKPIESLTWLSVGETLLHLYHYIDEEMEIYQFMCPVDMLQVTAIKPKEKKAEPKDDEDEEEAIVSDVPSEQGDTKSRKPRRRNSTTYLEHWMWGGQRRSARVRSTIRREADSDEGNVGEALRGLIPSYLLSENSQDERSKISEQVKINEESMNTMDMYYMFECMERSKDKKTEGKSYDDVLSKALSTEYFHVPNTCCKDVTKYLREETRYISKLSMDGEMEYSVTKKEKSGGNFPKDMEIIGDTDNKSFNAESEKQHGESIETKEQTERAGYFAASDLESSNQGRNKSINDIDNHITNHLERDCESAGGKNNTSTSSVVSESQAAFEKTSDNTDDTNHTDNHIIFEIEMKKNTSINNFNGSENKEKSFDSVVEKHSELKFICSDKIDYTEKVQIVELDTTDKASQSSIQKTEQHDQDITPELDTKNHGILTSHIESEHVEHVISIPHVENIGLPVNDDIEKKDGLSQAVMEVEKLMDKGEDGSNLCELKDDAIIDKDEDDNNLCELKENAAIIDKDGDVKNLCELKEDDPVIDKDEDGNNLCEFKEKDAAIIDKNDDINNLCELKEDHAIIDKDGNNLCKLKDDVNSYELKLKKSHLQMKDDVILKSTDDVCKERNVSNNSEERNKEEKTITDEQTSQLLSKNRGSEPNNDEIGFAEKACEEKNNVNTANINTAVNTSEICRKSSTDTFSDPPSLEICESENESDVVVLSSDTETKMECDVVFTEDDRNYGNKDSNSVKRNVKAIANGTAAKKAESKTEITVIELTDDDDDEVDGIAKTEKMVVGISDENDVEIVTVDEEKNKVVGTNAEQQIEIDESKVQYEKNETDANCTLSEASQPFKFKGIVSCENYENDLCTSTTNISSIEYSSVHAKNCETKKLEMMIIDSGDKEVIEQGSHDDKNKEPLKDLQSGCCPETCDVKEYILLNSKKHDIVRLLQKIVFILSKKWNLSWPEGLTSIYVDSFEFVKRHNQHYSMSHEYLLQHYELFRAQLWSLLLYAELILDKLFAIKLEGQEDSCPDIIQKILEAIAEMFMKIIHKNSFGEGFDVYVLRLLWLRSKCFLVQGESSETVCMLEQMIHYNEGSFKIILPNIRYHNKISKKTIKKLQLSLERNETISTVLLLFEQNKYEEVVEILKETFNYSQHIKEFITIPEHSPDLDRHSQLRMIMECLWKLDKLEDCFYWGEACFNEALQKYMNCEEQQQTVWMKTTKAILKALERIVHNGGLEIINNLNSQRLARLVENLISVMCQQLDVPPHIIELPFETVAPWILLQQILEYEYKKTENPNITLTEVPNYIQILLVSHDLLSRRSWCCSDEGALLLFSMSVIIPNTKNPRWRLIRERLTHSLEQIFYCLYLHPNKRPKGRVLQEHGVPQVSLNWKHAMQLFNFYAPDMLPEFDSNHIQSINAECEVLFKRIISLVPDTCNPADMVEKMNDYIYGRVAKVPVLGESSIRFPKQILSIYYLLGDYYFKNNEWSKAITHYLLDVCLNPVRLDSWAGMALARGSQLETKLNSCEKLTNENEFLTEAKAAVRCFQRASEIDPKHSVLWIEYGSFVYMMHSFCSRTLKQSDNLSMEMWTAVDEEKDRMLSLAIRCFLAANKVWSICGEEQGLQDERWLHHYMLGKVAEKRDPQPNNALKHYSKALNFLVQNRAFFSLKVSYTNPPNLAIEAIEIVYRIHTAILKYLKKNEGSSVSNELRSTFQYYIDLVKNSSFMSACYGENDSEIRKRRFSVEGRPEFQRKQPKHQTASQKLFASNCSKEINIEEDTIRDIEVDLKQLSDIKQIADSDLNIVSMSNFKQGAEVYNQTSENVQKDEKEHSKECRYIEKISNSGIEVMDYEKLIAESETIIVRKKINECQTNATDNSETNNDSKTEDEDLHKMNIDSPGEIADSVETDNKTLAQTPDDVEKQLENGKTVSDVFVIVEKDITKNSEKVCDEVTVEESDLLQDGSSQISGHNEFGKSQNLANNLGEIVYGENNVQSKEGLESYTEVIIKENTVDTEQPCEGVMEIMNVESNESKQLNLIESPCQQVVSDDLPDKNVEIYSMENIMESMEVQNKSDCVQNIVKSEELNEKVEENICDENMKTELPTRLLEDGAYNDLPDNSEKSPEDVSSIEDRKETVDNADMICDKKPGESDSGNTSDPEDSRSSSGDSSSDGATSASSKGTSNSSSNSDGSSSSSSDSSSEDDNSNSSDDSCEEASAKEKNVNKKGEGSDNRVKKKKPKEVGKNGIVSDSDSDDSSSDSKESNENDESSSEDEESDSSSDGSAATSQSSSSEDSSDSGMDVKEQDGVVDNTDLVNQCVMMLEECALRFPQHYKSIYQMAALYYHSKLYKDGVKCRQLLLDTYACQALPGRPTDTRIPGLFSDRKNNNIFNGVWRIPVNEIDRPGSFSTHMGHCMVLLTDVLREELDHKLLLELAIHLKRIPDPDKKYLRDSDREQLSRQAFTLCQQSIRKSMELSGDGKSLQLLRDVYTSYQRVQKHFPNKEKLFANLLLDCYKAHFQVKNATISSVIRFCQMQSLLAVRNPKLKSTAETTSSTQAPTTQEAMSTSATNISSVNTSVTMSTAAPKPRGRPPGSSKEKDKTSVSYSGAVQADVNRQYPMSSMVPPYYMYPDSNVLQSLTQSKNLPRLEEHIAALNMLNFQAHLSVYQAEFLRQFTSSSSAFVSPYNASLAAQNFPSTASAYSSYLMNHPATAASSIVKTTSQDSVCVPTSSTAVPKVSSKPEAKVTSPSLQQKLQATSQAFSRAMAQSNAVTTSPTTSLAAPLMTSSSSVGDYGRQHGICKSQKHGASSFKPTMLKYGNSSKGIHNEKHDKAFSVSYPSAASTTVTVSYASASSSAVKRPSPSHYNKLAEKRQKTKESTGWSRELKNQEVFRNFLQNYSVPTSTQNQPSGVMTPGMNEYLSFLYNVSNRSGLKITSPIKEGISRSSALELLSTSASSACATPVITHSEHKTFHPSSSDNVKSQKHSDLKQTGSTVTETDQVRQESVISKPHTSKDKPNVVILD